MKSDKIYHYLITTCKHTSKTNLIQAHVLCFNTLDPVEMLKEGTEGEKDSGFTVIYM